MRKVFIFVILIAGLLAGGFYLINNQLTPSNTVVQSVTADNFVTAAGIQWYQDPEKQFNLAIFTKPFTLSYSPENAQTLKEQSFLAGYAMAINGTYYRGSYVESEHSGLLQIAGERFWDLVPDKQLTHVVIYDEESDALSFIPANDFLDKDYEGDQYTLFQTGPIILQDGEVQTTQIKNSLNGEGRFLRTVLGITDAGEKFVLVTRVNFTLTALAEMLQAFPIFQGKKLTVVNLDGGNSTAMYSRDLDQFNYRESSRLPIVIGVK